MAVSERSLANLKPTPWSSTNQPANAGRKVGSRNRKTILREWLSTLTDAELDGKEYKGVTLADKMTLSMIKEAMNGNVAAFNSLMDGAFGKVPNVQLTDAVKPMDMSAYSTEQLEAMQAILANPANPHDPNAHIQDADIVE